MEEDQQTSRAAVVGAIVLAVVVAGILWYLLIFRDSSSNEETPEEMTAEESVEPTIVENSAPTPTPAPVSKELPSRNPEVAGANQGTDTPVQSVTTTTPTGAGSLAIAGSLLAAMGGGASLLVRRK